VPVLPPGASAPKLSAAGRGHRLFIAKGCGTCHVNDDVPEWAEWNEGGKVGPDLTGRRLEAQYVRQRLTDPSSLPAIGPGNVRMPNLGLAETEVAALVALLSGPRETATK
jgi:mono/diheme cytochrome c family protein